jgi:hypothetical protein
VNLDTKQVLKFPRMVAEIVFSILFFALTEVETFLMVVVSALLGWRLGWEWGVTIFFSLYLAARMTGGYVGLISAKLHLLAQATAEVRNREDSNG